MGKDTNELILNLQYLTVEQLHGILGSAWLGPELKKLKTVLNELDSYLLGSLVNGLLMAVSVKNTDELEHLNQYEFLITKEEYDKVLKILKITSLTKETFEDSVYNTLLNSSIAKV